MNMVPHSLIEIKNVAYEFEKCFFFFRIYCSNIILILLLTCLLHDAGGHEVETEMAVDRRPEMNQDHFSNFAGNALGQIRPQKNWQSCYIHYETMN